jgi:hypothetical protein
VTQAFSGSGLAFLGYNIVLGSPTIESAMHGFDLEVGRSIPVLEQFDPRAYIGFYHFDAEGDKTANGIRGRFTAQITKRLQVLAQVQNDGVFQTTASGGLIWTFGGRCSSSCGCPSLPDRLEEPVVREASVVVQSQQRVSGGDPLIDPATGQPFVVKFAAAGASPGGNGSFEHPYQTLSQLQAGSGPNQILFVENGQYPGGIRLQPGQRLLADGIVHMVVARQGTFALPILQPGAAATITVLDQPIVGFLQGTGIVMAANTEVSGFRFGQPFNPTNVYQNIYAAGINGAIDVNRNSLSGYVYLSGITGRVSVTGNMSAFPEGTISIDHIVGPVTFSNNVINTTFVTAVVDIAGPLTYTNNLINSDGGVAMISSNNVTTTWNVSNNENLGGGIAMEIIGNGGALSVNLIGNHTSGIGLKNLQYYANGNNGPIIDLGGSKPVPTPFP